MLKTVNINMGEMACGRNGEIIATNGIGSCLVIALFDEENKVGGMAHAMLPSPRTTEKNEVYEARANIIEGRVKGKYADEAIINMIKEIKDLGGDVKNLKAKIVGGAKMFKILSGDNFGIGYQNIESAKNKLNELNIPLISEDVGGTVGRNAELNLENGLLQVTTKM